MTQPRKSPGVWLATLFTCLFATTVFAQETAPKKLKAVHSRHGYLQMSVGRFISEPSVSQNYGECEIAE